MRKLFNQLVMNLAVLLSLISNPYICFSFTLAEGSTSDPGKNVQNRTILNLNSRLELFVDDYLIDRLVGDAKLRLHNPEPQDIAITLNESWEGNCSGYRSVFYDGGKYIMYYNTYDQKTQKTRNTVTEGHPEEIYGGFCCYAESYDGIHWYKPLLGLYEFQGSKANNIVFIKGLMGGVYADGGHSAVFKDENPDAPANEKYKAILTGTKQRGLFVFKSPDGIHWTPMSQTPIITDGAFDSQNLAFWDGARSEYRAYWRYFTKATDKESWGIRSIRTARSKDFINWYDQADLKYVDSPAEHLYTNQIKPYYRAPHILIGFPTRYIDRGWSESMRALPELEDREWRSGVSARFGTAITESLFMASRDGVLFKRWNEAFLRPGIERSGTWNYGNLYISWSVVETKSSLGGDAPNELSFYACENFRSTIAKVALRRYTLRMDGFVSVYAPMKGGEIITKPFTFTGKNLFLNFSSSAAGDIRIEIQDANGRPLPGFSLEDCPPIFGDAIERQIPWKNGVDLSKLEGKTIRLRFVLKDADLYSLRFK